MTLLKQFIKLEWLRKGVMSIHLVHESFKSVVLFCVFLQSTIYEVNKDLQIWPLTYLIPRPASAL